jgi:hypothetical protein
VYGTILPQIVHKECRKVYAVEYRVGLYYDMVRAGWNMSVEQKELVFERLREGFLEEVIDMFKRDERLHPFVVDMIRDESMRIRMAGAVLVEELAKYDRDAAVRLIPLIAELLRSASPMIRGDGAYLLGVIKHKDALPFLTAAENDSHEYARDIIKETIVEITETTHS